MIAAGLGIAAIGGAGLARAQGDESPSARETAVARSAFKSGMQAARSGDWEKARKAFKRAYDLVGRPLVLLNLAGAQVKTGRLVEGAESYREFLQLSKDGRAAKLQGAAKKQLGRLEERIPHMTIRAQGLRGGDQLAMDGEKLSRAVLGAPIPVNPGTHTIAVERAGKQIVEEKLEVKENQDKEVSLDVPEPSQTKPSDLGAAQPTKPSDEDKADAMLKASAEQDQPQTGGPEDTERRLVRSPWLWGGVGAAVAVGAATVAAVMLTRGEDSFQDGNFKDGGGHIWVGP